MKSEDEIKKRLNELYKEHIHEKRKYGKGKIRKAIEELEWIIDTKANV